MQRPSIADKETSAARAKPNMRRQGVTAAAVLYTTTRLTAGATRACLPHQRELARAAARHSRSVTSGATAGIETATTDASCASLVKRGELWGSPTHGNNTTNTARTLKGSAHKRLYAQTRPNNVRHNNADNVTNTARRGRVTRAVAAREQAHETHARAAQDKST